MFAARDGTGAQPLYYELDEEGGVSLASAPLALPAAAWGELPPGHFVAGRGSPRLQQFALTPLQVRAGGGGACMLCSAGRRWLCAPLLPTHPPTRPCS